MPPLVQDRSKTLSKRDLKPKKTKSRNGCSRCKLKRLKCDETAPGCVQCKKRGIACPGYEKTLKWSTKYEVLQPVQFEALPDRRRASDEGHDPPKVVDLRLPPDVVSGFEALAAVLPAAKGKSESPKIAAASKSLSPEQTSDIPSPVSQTESLKEQEPFQELASTSMDIDHLIDPSLMDGFLETVQPFNEELFSFDDLEALDFMHPSSTVDPDFDVEELPPLLDTSSTSTELASPRLSRSLLLDYYRIPNPSPAASLDDVESILVQHYFKDVCVLFSSFDSPLNPFRTTIGRLFQDSSSIYYAIQSMAAAHLANTFPHMTAVGMEMQRKACESLQEELPLVQSGQLNGGRTFLSIILLGITTCWHESSALGEDFLTTARSLILPKLLDNTESEEVQRQNQFFEESLIYWEMLMGFVTQDTMTFSAGTGLRSRMSKKTAPLARRPDGKIVPHPWTGIAPTVQILFAEVGRLIRRERMMHINGAVDIQRSQENLLNAATLEEDLLAAEYPLADELADPGDVRTSKHDFIVIAEAYRCAGLLELYRVFPAILRKRLGTDKFTWSDTVDFEFPTPRFETPYEDTDTKLWINSLAMHILETLESLPSSSGTCCLQPILILTAASELRFVSSVDYFDIYANDAKVLRSRDFVNRRLHEYALRLPAKPQKQVILLVKEVWRRLDEGQDTFWMDVMIEKGWHTVMG